METRGGPFLETHPAPLTETRQVLLAETRQSPFDGKPSRPRLTEAVKEFLTLARYHTPLRSKNMDRLCLGIQYKRLLYFGTDRFFSLRSVYIDGVHARFPSGIVVSTVLGTTVPFRGQATQISSELPPKLDCRPRRVELKCRGYRKVNTENAAAAGVRASPARTSYITWKFVCSHWDRMSEKHEEPLKSSRRKREVPTATGQEHRPTSPTE